MIKKILPVMVFIVIIQNGFSQREIITLTFQAKDSLTQSPLALDSVIVKNLTENCDTILYDSVSVLNIEASWPVGIDELTLRNSESFIVMQNVPNPFKGTTMARIYLKREGELNLEVYDNQGKRLSQYDNILGKGWHQFGISTSGTHQLFLKVSDHTTSKTIRIISDGIGSDGDRIFYKGHSEPGYKSVLSFPDITGFIYYLGNQLQYSAYVEGYYESILFDNPVLNETYTFAMLPVITLTIPTLTTSSVINITQTTATSGGYVTYDGGAIVTVRGVCWSTLPNPTTTDSHTTDGSGTGGFVSYLTGLNENTLYFVRAYATNSVGTAYGNEISFTTLVWTCGDSILINHMVSGGVAPVNKTVTYGTVTNIPGEASKCWITSNLGSDHQATSVNDATEASAGWYWQFNLKQGYKHDGTTRTPNSTWIDYISENSDWQAEKDPCSLELGAGWRPPTYTEWVNVDASGTWNNWNDPWNSALKLHGAGTLYFLNGSLMNRGSLGCYWSGIQYDSGNSWVLDIDNAGSGVWGWGKVNGFSMRCIKD